MRSNFIILIISFLMSYVNAMDLSDVKFNPKELIDGQEVILKGTGVQKKFFFKINAVALYSNNKKKSLKEIMDDNENKELIIIMLRDLSGEKVANQVEKDFKNFSTDKEYSDLKFYIDKIVTLYKELGEIKEGSKIIVKWSNKDGVSATFNDKKFGETVNNKLLFELILRPFISENAPKDLRTSLLSY